MNDPGDVLPPPVPPAGAPAPGATPFATPLATPLATPVRLRSEARGVSAHAAFGSETGGRRDARRRLARTPAFVLGAALALTTAAAAAAAVVGRARDEARFDNAVQDARDRVITRADIYTTLLYGARALFETSDSVSAAQFRTYVRHLDLGRLYPGIRGIGFSRLLSAPGAGIGTTSDSATLAAALRAGGSPALRLWPSPTEAARAEYHAIVYLEPLDRRNAAALGFDMSSEPLRRAAMQRARDTGTPAASALVTLKQEIESEQQPGLLIYLPVYVGGTTPRTVDERRRALRGFVYAPLRAGELFADIFGSEEYPPVALRVFDGRDTSAAALLFDSRALAPVDGDAAAPTGASRFVHSDTISIAGRRWTLAYAPLPASGFGTGTTAALWIGVFGVGVSAALFYATRAEVRARQDAEHSDALRARFFAAMSHELRTPINAIMGYNDLIVAGIYGPVSDEQRYGIERSQRAARHLLELVNDVLDVSKLEAGKVEVLSEDVELDALLDDLLVTIAPVADERGCVLRLERDRCGLTLRTDPRRLRQILLNLLSNATKFAPGGLVTVRCEPLPHGSALPGDHRGGERRRTSGDAVVIAVSDQGPGIAPADHERIFEEFVQLPSPTSGGTGLGLPISRRLAELLGGTLSLSSAPGRGSTFFVTLPRTPRRERAHRLTPATKA